MLFIISFSVVFVVSVGDYPCLPKLAVERKVQTLGLQCGGDQTHWFTVSERNILIHKADQAGYEIIGLLAYENGGNLGAHQLGETLFLFLSRGHGAGEIKL